MKVLILGANGMLGHKLFQVLQNQLNFDTYGTIRDANNINFFSQKNKIFTSIKNLIDIKKTIKDLKPNIIINCIGITRKNNTDINELREMINVNSILPHQLLLLAKEHNLRLIHISTDCVFSGNKGNYKEEDIPDPHDDYGKSKLLGEFNDGANLVIRTSIIGPELKTNRGLLEWFLNVKERCDGYKEAIFSGFTTLELSNIIGKIIIPRKDINGLLNVSSNPISKAKLLEIINEVYKKRVKIDVSDILRIDRSLNNETFLKKTNYNPPTWNKMILQMFLEPRVTYVKK